MTEMFKNSNPASWVLVEFDDKGIEEKWQNFLEAREKLQGAAHELERAVKGCMKFTLTSKTDKENALQ